MTPQVEALDQFGELDLIGKYCLDVGASTGGFTEVLLRRGASSVVSIDVGHDQMVADLKDSPKVTCSEGFNARQLSPETLAEAGVTKADFDIVVADLSFISLTLVLEQILSVARGADLVLLIKPQFEAGREEVGKGGVVRDPDVHTRVCNEIKMWLVEKNWTVHGLTTSPITGPQGNVEFLVWAQKRVAPIVELQHLA